MAVIEVLLFLMGWSATVNALPTLHARNASSSLMGFQTQCLQNAAIGFDDGPYIYEKELVDEMISYGANATFFVNGYNYDCIYDEEVVTNLRYAYEKGFTIGSHTWNHYDITTQGTAELGLQLDLVEAALQKILGIRPALFRPPYGTYNAELVSYLNSRGYTVVGWSDDTGDSVGASVASSIAIVQAATNGTILLAHETKPTTVEEVIPGSVPALLAKGVKLVTIDQCLGVPPYQSVGPYGVRDETWTCAGTPAP